MNQIRFCLSILLAVSFFVCSGQGTKYDLGAPLDLVRNSGWNKVLCMKNGNTLLFHFDLNKPVTIMVFDSVHKEIASHEHFTRVFDITRLETAVFKGLFETNGEAVLFFEQWHLGKEELVRLRFRGNDGSLVEEAVAGESKGISKETQFFVMKNKAEDDYAILFCTEVPQFRKCELYVAYYNNKHETLKQVPLEADRGKYDYLYVVGAERQPNGISVILDLTTLVDNPTASEGSPERAIYDHDLGIYYIPKDSSRAFKKVVNVTTETYPDYIKYAYNSFANTLNVLLYSYYPIYYQFGLNIERGSISQNLFFISDPGNGGIKLNYINYKFANACLKQKTDTSKLFYGIPMGMCTNDNGLTTVVTEAYERYDEPETQERYNYDTYLGNIAITRLDDLGNELWGTLLPHAECFKSYKRFCEPSEFAKKRVDSFVFNDFPEQVYERQFLSLNTYNYGKNTFIIFNDYDKNFNKPNNKTMDTVYNYSNTNACYYELNNKNEVTKNYLFGVPAYHEFKCSFIEGADFDEQRGTYATLVQYKRHETTSLRMAWAKLD